MLTGHTRIMPFIAPGHAMFDINRPNTSVLMQIVQVVTRTFYFTVHAVFGLAVSHACVWPAAAAAAAAAAANVLPVEIAARAG